MIFWHHEICGRRSCSCPSQRRGDVGEGRTRRWEQEVLQGCHENQGSGDWAAEGPRWASGRGCVTWVWSWGSRSAQGPAASLVLPVVRGAQSVPWKLRRAVEDKGPARLSKPSQHLCSDGGGSRRACSGAGRYGTLTGLASWEVTLLSLACWPVSARVCVCLCVWARVSRVGACRLVSARAGSCWRVPARVGACRLVLARAGTLLAAIILI